MKVKRLAQSTIILTNSTGRTLLIDPGKYNLETGRYNIENFPVADVLIITHKHPDHFDLELIKNLVSRGSFEIITNQEIHQILKENSVKSKAVSVGEEISVHGFKLFIIDTDHVVRGEHIINFGLVVESDDISLYYTSDTRFIDPSLLPEKTRAKILCIPISNRGVVMGIDDALVFAATLKPDLIIPLHYDSPKDKERVNPREFYDKALKDKLSVKILAFGEELSL